MYNKNDWDKRTKSDFEYLNSLGYEVLGVFMVGSQNYELDIENSDIDTKAIVIPKINDIVLNKQPESRLIVLENSEHIEVKDIREMFKCLLKQNINFLEILFSKSSYINPEYKEEFNKLYYAREEIAHYRPMDFVNCCMGTSINKFNSMLHERPGNVLDFKEIGYDRKDCYHIIRQYETLCKYILANPFSECLISDKNKEEILKIKRGLVDKKAAEKCAIKYIGYTKSIVNSIKSNDFSHFQKNQKDIEEYLNSISLNCIKYCFRKELLNDLYK